MPPILPSETLNSVNDITDSVSACNCRPLTTALDSAEKLPDNEVYTANNRNMSSNTNQRGTFYFHLGVLIFAPFFNKLHKKGLQYIQQWLVAVLLGCQNIEQSKELNYSSLQAMLGTAHKTLHIQRISLKEAASRTNTEQILQFNAELLNVNKQRDFYYDPHTKHYTGHLKILSTWCASIRLADKGINMDYIHTTTGHPVYFKTMDNFYDLRERFPLNITEFRKLLNFDKKDVLTYIIDRGIYSIIVFMAIIESEDTHIITWEKDYKKDKWNEEDSYGKGAIVKKRNNNQDTKLVHYRYQELTWDKHPKMRQIIVRIYDKNWKVLIEVSILTDDKNRPANEIIELMLTRWVQENDFKYMIKHFGLNQITSYASTDYKALRDKIEDKIHTCSNHKAQTKVIQKVRAKFKTALLRKHNFEEKHKNTNAKLSSKEQARKKDIWNSVSKLSATLSALEQERKKTPKQVSKIEDLIEQDYQKLDTNTKDFMDAIKILARNIFYLSFEPFKKKYNNYRDDHVLFRHLIRSAGTISSTTNNLEIQLQPQMEYQPNITKIITLVLDQINEIKPEIPDGSERKIKLLLKI